MSQCGGKAEVSSGDSLVLGRPADDEPDLHRHCLVRTPLHLVQSPFRRNSERCRTEGKERAAVLLEVWFDSGRLDASLSYQACRDTLVR
jgi:hypothetical protein